MFAWNGGGMINYEANGVTYAAERGHGIWGLFLYAGCPTVYRKTDRARQRGLETGSSSPLPWLAMTAGSDATTVIRQSSGRLSGSTTGLLTIIGVTPMGFTGLDVEAVRMRLYRLGSPAARVFGNPRVYPCTW